MVEERAGKRIKTHDGASSSSAAAPISEYQVFLSFSGVDIRKSFTDHLYRNLTGAGILTFRDNEELCVGKEIRTDLLEAIEKSTISIPIFSRRYASSKWCLMELTQMVKCMNRNNGRHTICPIFYDVTPSDVKHQTGSYEKAFLEHTDEPDVKEWKEALEQVAKLKGWEKVKVANGHEGELIKIIVTEVCRMLKKSHVSLPVNLVGMDHHLEKMTKLLDIESGNGVRIVGIIGMGGIGKTTIAKFMYNKHCDDFEQQCTFLEDVMENVVRKGYAELQKQLISAVLKRTLDGITVDINMLKDKKVLIVLDDVKDRLQLNEIIRSRDCFGSGSRIIVTTRNKDVFLEEEGVPPYEPKGMDFVDSLLLFSKHAFKSTKPSEGFEDISRQLAQSAAGLPLSLVVIGSMLYKKKKIIWEETLKKLEDIPPEKVFERLKISYDALDDGQKQIFLDIACHFIGEDKTLPFYMWEDCKFYPETGIDTLIKLSLVTLKDESIFRMHDQLRDLGRHIVYQENPSDLEKRSRLWSHKEAEEVLTNQSGTKKVQTLHIEYDEDSRDEDFGDEDSRDEDFGYEDSRDEDFGDEDFGYEDSRDEDFGDEDSRDEDFEERFYCFSNRNFEGMSKLRYLHLDYPSNLEGEFKRLFPQLRWFRCVLTSIAVTYFCPRKLVILNLSRSTISDVHWESLWKQMEQPLSNLKVLDLSDCSGLTKTPDFSKFCKLEWLILQGCTNLTEIGSSVKSLKRLKLPRVGIEMLQKLELLDCSRCVSLEGPLPEGIWRLSSLRVLKLNSTKITGGLPKDISGMSRLEDLDLENCENLRLPTEGLKLPLSLTRLGIPFTKATLESLRSLVNLRTLIFHTSCQNYCDSHPNNNDSGTSLLPTIDMPSNLEVLWLIGLDDHVACCRLLPVPVMKFDFSSRLDRLEILNFRGVSLSGSLDLSNCQMLKKLQIIACGKMREIGDLGSSWEYIEIDSCTSLEVLSDLSSMKRLKNLFIGHCPKLREIKGLEVLTSLEELEIRGCPHLTRAQLHRDLLNSESLNIIFTAGWI